MDTSIKTLLDAAEAPTPRHLAATRLLDHRSARITGLVAERGWAKLPVHERVGAIYDFVREEVGFGYSAGDDLPASRVLADGYGNCNTKAILLMALLRAGGVPCRFHGAAIHKELQQGVVPALFFKMAPAELLHSWVEVHVDGRWTRLEGVILDAAYLDGIRARFPQQTGEFMGFGIGTTQLADPPVEWTGADTEIQMTALSTDHGTFDDPDEFFTSIGVNLSGVRGVLYRHVVRHLMNRRVRDVRSCPR